MRHSRLAAAGVSQHITYKIALMRYDSSLSVADHQRISVISVHRSPPLPSAPGFALPTARTDVIVPCRLLGRRAIVHSVVAPHPIWDKLPSHLKSSRTETSVENCSSQVLRPGTLCKLIHTRRLWEFCLSGALQTLDLIDWLIDSWWGDVFKKA